MAQLMTASFGEGLTFANHVEQHQFQFFGNIWIINIEIDGRRGAREQTGIRCVRIAIEPDINIGLGRYYVGLVGYIDRFADAGNRQKSCAQ